MQQLDGCQIPCLPKMSEGMDDAQPQSLVKRFKRALAVPWNYTVKKGLKNLYRAWSSWRGKSSRAASPASQSAVAQPPALAKGDLVRVRTLEEIQATLDPFKELKGCAFLPYMAEYCGTQQRVLQVVQRFLDERDYKVKKVRGVVLLGGVICKGTPVFGACDRCCFLFWREEWLEKIEPDQSPGT